MLSKPIGSGVLTSAAKSGRLEQADLAETIAVMIHLNRGAGEAMVEVGVHAATDITGFGLLGHAYEMAQAGGVGLTIEAGAVPLLQRTLDLAGQGVVTRAHRATLDHLGERLQIEGVDQTLVNVLADAQTSGGLLMSVAAGRADALVEALQRRQTPCAAVVGQVGAAGDPTIRLV